MLKWIYQDSFPVRKFNSIQKLIFCDDLSISSIFFLTLDIFLSCVILKFSIFFLHTKIFRQLQDGVKVLVLKL